MPSLDDFGTGFSSLTYLRNLPVETLKIDKSFVDKILADTVQNDFVRSIIDMAHAIGLQVTAEGVESEVQLEILAQYGCDCVQGYIFSKPVSRKKLCFFQVAKLKTNLSSIRPDQKRLIFAGRSLEARRENTPRIKDAGGPRLATSGIFYSFVFFSCITIVALQENFCTRAKR